MPPEEGQKSSVPNLFLNPIGFWQYYLLTWIEVSKGSYESAIKAGEYWLKVLCDPWIRAISSDKKEKAKVE
jgi:hypothetical protein